MHSTDRTKIGIVELQQVVKLKNLPLNTPYSIFRAKIVSSKFRRAVLKLNAFSFLSQKSNRELQTTS